MLRRKLFISHLIRSAENDPMLLKRRSEFEKEMNESQRISIFHRQRIFDYLSRDFPCEKGKVESKLERA
jgi:hypothetical protein